MAGTNKVNVSQIVRDHVSTLRNQSTDEFSVADFAVQFFVPLVPVVVYFFLQPPLNNGAGSSVDGAIMAAFAVFTALLFNLQVMILGLLQEKGKSKSLQPVTNEVQSENDVLLERDKTLGHNFVQEIFYNVSYSILISIVLVAVSIVTVLFGWTEMFIPKIIELYLIGHFLLVGLMVLKRTHSLFSKF